MDTNGASPLTPLESSHYYQNHTAAPDAAGIMAQTTGVENTGNNLETRIEIPQTAATIKQLTKRIRQEQQRIDNLTEDIRQIEQGETTMCGRPYSIRSIFLFQLLIVTVATGVNIYNSYTFYHRQP